MSMPKFDYAIECLERDLKSYRQLVDCGNPEKLIIKIIAELEKAIEILKSAGKKVDNYQRDVNFDGNKWTKAST